MKVKSILIFTIAILLIIVFALFSLRYYLHGKYCTDTFRRSSNGDITAVVHEEMCDGFGASDVVSVYLEKKLLGVYKVKETVFKYDPSEFSEPLNISWVGHDTLRISIDRVQFIEKQTPGAYGTTAIYSIGAVGNPRVDSKGAPKPSGRLE